MRLAKMVNMYHHLFWQATYGLALGRASISQIAGCLVSTTGIPSLYVISGSFCVAYAFSG
jgi:hypothetical protein